MTNQRGTNVKKSIVAALALGLLAAGCKSAADRANDNPDRPQGGTNRPTLYLPTARALRALGIYVPDTIADDEPLLPVTETVIL